MTRSVVALVVALGLGLSAWTGVQSQPSPVRADERVVLFNTAGWLDSGGARWHVPVHGWIHEPEDSRWRKAAAEKLLESVYGLTVTPQTRANFDGRINALLADNERGKRLTIDFGGARFTLDPSGPNGHFHGNVAIDPAMARRLAADGLLAYRILLPEQDTRSFSGASKLVPRSGLSVISDIDDTIKHTQVRDRRAMLDRSLLRDFEAVPGMPELYRAWSARGVSFHFVSSSPWHLFDDPATLELPAPWSHAP